MYCNRDSIYYPMYLKRSLRDSYLNINFNITAKVKYRINNDLLLMNKICSLYCMFHRSHFQHNIPSSILQHSINYFCLLVNFLDKYLSILYYINRSLLYILCKHYIQMISSEHIHCSRVNRFVLKNQRILQSILLGII